jgi:hypothetical protein
VLIVASDSAPTAKKDKFKSVLPITCEMTDYMGGYYIITPFKDGESGKGNN